MYVCMYAQAPNILRSAAVVNPSQLLVNAKLEKMFVLQLLTHLIWKNFHYYYYYVNHNLIPIGMIDIINIIILILILII